jgi:pimeloyl-ACP methyl ester carboxylesterase
MKNNASSYLAAGLLGAIAGCAHLAPEPESHPPIIFVHGAGGDAARWMTTLWRFESNGWPRERLFAFDIINPTSGPEFDKPAPNTTTSAEHLAQVIAEIDRVRRITGADKVVLVANSRGGLPIRDYVRNGEGRRVVSHVVLGGTPNHGIWSTPEFLPRHEFNATGPYLRPLNAPQGPDGLEVTPGVAFMTIRSDTLDKWMQPDGRWLGEAKLRTNVLFTSAELKGAENIVLPGADHLEVSYGPRAFAHTYRFITGRAPRTTDIVPERTVVLDGMLTVSSPALTNLPAASANIEVHEVDCRSGERMRLVHKKVTSSDGRWGPMNGLPDACYEFVGWADGTAYNHIYRSPFPRSSSVVHLRLANMSEANKKAASAVTMVRGRGFFSLGRQRISLDGKDPPGIAAGVPGLNASTLNLDEGGTRTVVAEYGDERIAMRTWPTSENRFARAEFHY